MAEWKLPALIATLREQARWQREILLAMRMGRPIRVMHLKENRIYIISPSGRIEREEG